MKTLLLLTTTILLMSPTIQAQNSTLPTTELYTCNGITISSDDILKDSQPTVIVFWKTYDERCVAHISSLLDSRDEVIEEDSLEFIIICVDCIGQTNHIKPFVMGQSWDATVYIDMNGDFKRNMGIVETPMTLMYDADQNLVCQYTGYCSGGDELICEKMKECLVKN